MNDQSILDKFTAIAVSLLLILTAWGNAKEISREVIYKDPSEDDLCVD